MSGGKHCCRRCFGPDTAQGNTALAADGTGKEGQVPIAVFHLIGSRGKKNFQLGYRIIEAVSVDIREENAVSGMKFLQLPKVRSIVMSGNDEGVGIDRTLVAAGRDLQLRIAPIT